MQINVKTNEDFKTCNDCIHSDDSVEVCKLRECVHAIVVKECYEPKMKLNGTPLQEPSGDLISRQDAIRICEERGHDNSAYCMRQLPSVNPQPKTGHWKNNKCDVCGASRPPLFDNYCPNCGARMEREG